MANHQLKELMKIMKCDKIEDIDFSKMDLENLLSLFYLTSPTITLKDVKQAKSITNKTHPDKSHLPSEYFIFYKNAFSIILELYEDNRKMSKDPDVQNTTYNCHLDDAMIGSDVLQNYDQDNFSKEFNFFYDKTFKQKEREEAEEKNTWFCEKEEKIQDHLDITNSLGKEELILKIKNDQRNKINTDIVEHKTIQPLNSGGFNGYQLFDAKQSGYISSANSGDLMYDDIRRVHRDETVFTVDLCDFDIKSSKTLESLQQDREDLQIGPMLSESIFNTTFNDAFDKTEKFRRDVYDRKKFEDLKESNVNDTLFQLFKSRFMNLT